MGVSYNHSRSIVTSSDLDDFDTSILFGDAATATVLYGENHLDRATAKLHRPDLSAKGEDGTTLSVPLRNSGFIQMKGRRVFQEAVRCMMSSLNRVCTREELQVEDLDLVVPHQANQRIMDAIQHRISPQVFSNIAQHGNTSSTSHLPERNPTRCSTGSNDWTLCIRRWFHFRGRNHQDALER